MNSIILSDSASRFENEEYFPIRVVFDSSVEGIKHAGFYNGDEDLLEIAYDKETGKLKTIQIVICHNYSIIDSDYSLPVSCLGSDGDAIAVVDHFECPCFGMQIYNDCIVVTVSDHMISQYIRCGQVLFGIDEDKRIVSVIVSCLSKANVAHCIEELGMQ